MNLLDVYKELNTEEKCLAFLERMRWPDGVKCLSCESLRITRITAKGKTNKKTGKTGPDRDLYQCNECRFQFTATTGTVYHDTHLPLHKWFLAIALITESKKGISANQLRRALGVQYRTAWHLAHRIRLAMKRNSVPALLKGKVEVDETYIGGHTRKGIRGRGSERKTPVMALVERQGDIRVRSLANVTGRKLEDAIRECVDKDATILTDDWASYRGIGKEFAGGHKVVQHSIGEYDSQPNAVYSWTRCLPILPPADRESCENRARQGIW